MDQWTMNGTARCIVMLYRNTQVLAVQSTSAGGHQRDCVGRGVCPTAHAQGRGNRGGGSGGNLPTTRLRSCVGGRRPPNFGENW